MQFRSHAFRAIYLEIQGSYSLQLRGCKEKRAIMPNRVQSTSESEPLCAATQVIGQFLSELSSDPGLPSN